MFCKDCHRSIQHSQTDDLCDVCRATADIREKYDNLLLALADLRALIIDDFDEPDKCEMIGSPLAVIKNAQAWIERLKSKTEPIGDRVRSFVRTINLPGAAIEINGDTMLDVRVVCDGEDHMMGYRCCLVPGHRGDCYTVTKKLYFLRQN